MMFSPIEFSPRAARRRCGPASHDAAGGPGGPTILRLLGQTKKSPGQTARPASNAGSSAGVRAEPNTVTFAPASDRVVNTLKADSAARRAVRLSSFRSPNARRGGPGWANLVRPDFP